VNYSVSRRNLFRLAPLGMLSPLAAQTPTISETFLNNRRPWSRNGGRFPWQHQKGARTRRGTIRPWPKAVWDWGFGDWESALGAASHVGNREIAEYLIAHGARPSLFSATMLGHLDVVKAFIAAQPGVTENPWTAQYQSAGSRQSRGSRGSASPRVSRIAGRCRLTADCAAHGGAGNRACGQI